MPFHKGIEKIAGSGRQKGKATRLSREVAARLEALGCDPIAGLVRIAEDRTVDVAIRGRIYAELAAFCYPKLRAIEHTGPAGEPIELRALTGKQALEARIAGIRERLGTRRPEDSLLMNGVRNSTLLKPYQKGLGNST